MTLNLTVGQINRLIESLRKTVACPADRRLLEYLEEELEKEERLLGYVSVCEIDLDEIPF